MGILGLYRELKGWRAPEDGAEVILYAKEERSVPPPAEPLPGPSASRPFVSLIATVKNEGPVIEDWLRSLLTQTRLPDEIVIVDGGSTDGTYELLARLAFQSRVPIQVFREPGLNIAAGRNRAIQHARGPLIACTDAGCAVPPEWLASITGPFAADPTIEVVAGYYSGSASTDFERTQALFFCPPASSVEAQDFLPSTRSIAFQKAAWAKVGGFPEWLTLTGEDTCFDLALKTQTRRWAFVPEAEVQWKLEPGLARLFKKVYWYGRGAGEAGVYFQQYFAEPTAFWAKILGALVLIAAGSLVALGQREWLALPVALVASLWLTRIVVRRAPPPVDARGFRRGRMYASSVAILCTIKLAMMLGFVKGLFTRQRICSRETGPRRSHVAGDKLQPGEVRE